MCIYVTKILAFRGGGSIGCVPLDPVNRFCHMQTEEDGYEGCLVD